ncbi:MAG: chemotaxis protein CheW [Thermodesulfobacteriota bacterium]
MDTTRNYQGGTYLTFYLERELFGLNIQTVREVLDYTSITRVPMTADFMRGVINVRGHVVPVVDLRSKFGMTATEHTVNTCIVIVEMECDGETTIMGALVDGVQEVLDIPPAQIEKAPRLGSRIDSRFIQGIGKLGDRFVMLLDIQAIFSTDELAEISGMQRDEMAMEA